MLTRAALLLAAVISLTSGPALAVDVVVQAKSQTPKNTGVNVRKGQRIQMKASGTWCMGGVPPNAECGGPGGIRTANPAELPLVLNSAKIGALIGRVGDGPWFLVGKERRIEAKRNGQLRLLFNDRPCCFGDNSGSVKAKITRLN